MLIKLQFIIQMYTSKFLTFSIRNVMAAYFTFYFFIRTDLEMAFVSITLYEIIVKPGKQRLPAFLLRDY